VDSSEESSLPSHMQKAQDTNSNGRGKKTVARTSSGLNQRFVDALGWIITVIWAVSMIFRALEIGPEPHMSIHILMATVAGTAFGTNFIKKTGGPDAS